METELNHLTANMAALESENNKLRAELATSNRCLFQMQEAAKVLSAELAGLRAQVPVAYMHNKRVDVIHTSVKSLLSDFAVNSGPESMLRPIDKQEHYTIPLYARPVPPAAVPDDVAKDAEVGAAIERACRDLPAWCAIEVRVERGSATVSAYNEECDEVLIDECGEESLAEQVDTALTAILAAKEKGQ